MTPRTLPRSGTGVTPLSMAFAPGRHKLNLRRLLVLGPNYDGTCVDEVMGPRERPKEGTTPAVKRPASVAGSHPQPRLFGAGLPSRAQLHVTRLVVQLKVGCPTPS